ncbi:uncharacterized protein VTP21DRAFT_3375 [Calcarisporiella thermophila]|uniref:uncharacterized protein n=1 Tax=Calcarisporiella thermophila TaxID=911321 RepID=UPI003742AF63
MSTPAGNDDHYSPEKAEAGGFENGSEEVELVTPRGMSNSDQGQDAGESGGGEKAAAGGTFPPTAPAQGPYYYHPGATTGPYPANPYVVYPYYSAPTAGNGYYGTPTGTASGGSGGYYYPTDPAAFYPSEPPTPGAMSPQPAPGMPMTYPVGPPHHPHSQHPHPHAHPYYPAPLHMPAIHSHHPPHPRPPMSHHPHQQSPPTPARSTRTSGYTSPVVSAGRPPAVTLPITGAPGGPRGQRYSAGGAGAVMTQQPALRPENGGGGGKHHPKNLAMWVGNLPDDCNTEELEAFFADEQVESIYHLPKSNCAFVNFKNRDALTKALEKYHNSDFNGTKLVCRPQRPLSHENPAWPFAAAYNPPRYQQPQVASSGRKLKERYFILKSLTQEDLDISVGTGMWATQPRNEAVLNSAFKDADTVYLIYSANKSGEFYGFAKMAGPISTPSQKVQWAPVHKELTGEESNEEEEGREGQDNKEVDIAEQNEEFREAEMESEADLEGAEQEGFPPKDKRWGSEFKVQWIMLHKLPFTQTRHLRNPWNSNREVKVSRDGTEVETSVGEALIREFYRYEQIQRELGANPALQRRGEQLGGVEGAEEMAASGGRPHFAPRPRPPRPHSMQRPHFRPGGMPPQRYPGPHQLHPMMYKPQPYYRPNAGGYAGRDAGWVPPEMSGMGGYYPAYGHPGGYVYQVPHPAPGAPNVTSHPVQPSPLIPMLPPSVAPPVPPTTATTTTTVSSTSSPSSPMSSTGPKVEGLEMEMGKLNVGEKEG